jgi:hypothetical protein
MGVGCTGATVSFAAALFFLVLGSVQKGIARVMVVSLFAVVGTVSSPRLIS